MILRDMDRMERWIGKVAVVTGASSGIGAATAKAFVEAGLIVVGLARRAENIEKIARELEAAKAKGKLYARKTDISDTKQIIEAFNWIRNTIGIVHILVNNAGALPPTTLYDGNPEDWKTIIDVNLLGVAVCTKEAIKQMRENDIAGHIVHINSIAGHAPLRLPNLSMYPATKYGVTAMTETLRTELVNIGSKIKVSSVSPGAVVTPMVRDHSENPELAKSMSNIPYLQPEDIADAVLYVIGTPPHVQIHELTIKPVGEPF